MKKYEIAKKIEAVFKKMSKEYSWDNSPQIRDTRIYFNNKAWCWYNGSKQTIEDIKASDYTEYANDDTITCTFEGAVYEALNYDDHNRWKLREELEDVLSAYGYYFEMGNAWNFSVYEI